MAHVSSKLMQSTDIFKHKQQFISIQVLSHRWEPLSEVIGAERASLSNWVKTCQHQ